MTPLIAAAVSLLVGLILGAVSFRPRPRVKAIYYDSSGVCTNPPNVFEMTARKTLNFQVDKKHVARFPQISAGEGLVALSKIELAYGEISRLVQASEKEGTPLSPRVGELSMRLIAVIYLLCVPYSEGGIKFRLAFFKRCFEDSAFLMTISRALIDLWLKKKAVMRKISGAIPSPWTGGDWPYTATLKAQGIGNGMTFRFGLSSN